MRNYCEYLWLLEGCARFIGMNKKSVEPLEAILEALRYLESDAKATEAEEVAFYISAAVLAAEEYIALEKAHRRMKPRSAEARALKARSATAE